MKLVSSEPSGLNLTMLPVIPLLRFPAARILPSSSVLMARTVVLKNVGEKVESLTPELTIVMVEMLWRGGTTALIGEERVRMNVSEPSTRASGRMGTKIVRVLLSPEAHWRVPVVA